MTNTVYFSQTIREHRPTVEWLHANSRNHNCGCDELLDAKGNVQQQPMFHNCEYIHARNRYIPKAIMLASDVNGLDRHRFSAEMDKYGRTLL